MIQIKIKIKQIKNVISYSSVLYSTIHKVMCKDVRFHCRCTVNYIRYITVKQINKIGENILKRNTMQ
uniref:Uncharacterized protein n=1 Tax=Anguilla anguilla TaxID=7936 RepID=A0A0E9RXS1_ANGAN